jgi:hypothetical protein
MCGYVEASCTKMQRHIQNKTPKQSPGLTRLEGQNVCAITMQYLHVKITATAEGRKREIISAHVDHTLCLEM